MLYYLFHYLDTLDFPGAGIFHYISFRSAFAVILSLFIATIYGKKIIKILRKKEINENVRDLDLEGKYQKEGTPTIGGIIIIASILIPTLLLCKLDNIYIILMLITTLWLGTIGFIDDYIKVFKKNKRGLRARFKLFGQVGLGLIVGLTLFINDDAVIRERIPLADFQKIADKENIKKMVTNGEYVVIDIKSTRTNIPFFKDNEFDYSQFVGFMGQKAITYGWVLFIIMTIIIITSVSNGANMTDGLDGLATGTSAIIGVTLAVLAYVSGNVIYADYLNIMFIPNVGELVIFISAFIGATIGFLWYNSYPAQIFMGDTGSLTLGGIIAVFAISIHKELLIPILCGIFLVENLSVMLQVSYFKYSKKRWGRGRRIFKMAPLHHHYQMKGYPEPKIVIRFWIIGILLAIITVLTLKVR